MKKNSQQGWIGVDLDGTLAYYDHWRGPTHIGKPLAPMVKRVKMWLEKGREVRIFTARLGKRSQRIQARRAIRTWCMEQFGQPLVVTNEKDMAMVELWDDRAIQVVKNTGIPITKGGVLSKS